MSSLGLSRGPDGSIDRVADPPMAIWRALADIQAKHQALMSAAMKLGEAIYASQQEETAHADAAADASADGDDVVDADFEEVDGNKN